MSNEEKKKRIKLSSWQLLTLGILIVLLGVAFNFALGRILKSYGVIENISVWFSFSGLPLVLLGDWIIIFPAKKARGKELLTDLWIKDSMDLAPNSANVLWHELHDNGEQESSNPVIMDAFGDLNLNRYMEVNSFKLYINEDAPFDSIQKMQTRFNLGEVRKLHQQRITQLVLMGGEPLQHLDATVRLAGTFRKIFNSNTYKGLFSYYMPITNLLICTSTTDLDSLITITNLEGLIDGFIYIPYNQSSLQTLLDYTKYLNTVYPKRHSTLAQNRVKMLPWIRETLSDEEIKLLKTRWAIDSVKSISEIEKWKGTHIRRLKKFIND